MEKGVFLMFPVKRHTLQRFCVILGDIKIYINFKHFQFCQFHVHFIGKGEAFHGLLYFYDALSSGNLGFAPYGNSVNHFLIGENSSAANQILSCMWLLKLPWRAKPRVPFERA